MDETLIDPLLWERKDRAPGEKADQGEVERVMTAAEEGSLDLSKSADVETEDAPMIPPDEWVPDDEKMA